MMKKYETILLNRISLGRIFCLLAAMLLAVTSVPAHEGHDHPSERIQALPLVGSLRVNFGATRFQLGPLSHDLLNTLVIPGEGRVSIPTQLSGMRRLAILHTGLGLEEVAECRVEIKYAGLDEPVISPWKVQDWQANR